MAELGLIIPGLTGVAGTALSPRVRAWLARARALPALPGGLDAVLAGCAAPALDARAVPAAAPLKALGDGVAAADAGAGELRELALVEPVSLAVHTDHVTVAGAPAPPLAPDDAAALADALGTLWAEDGLEIEVAAPSRWYLCGPGVAAMAAGIAPVVECLGARFDQALLPSQAHIRLRRLLTEAQMLFHAHAVNARREAAGQPPIDGVWLSGGGRQVGSLTCEAQLFAAAPLAMGLMRLAGRAVQPAPQDFAALLEDWPADTHTCWVLLPPADEAALERLEHDWLRPAWRALARGRLAGLAWRDETGRGGRMGRRDRLRWWVRRWP